MPQKTYKTAAVIIPPNELWSPIQTIRHHHDRQVRRWMPHITLLYPFRPKEEFAAVAEQLGKVGKQTAPFRITLAQFRLFEHRLGRYTVWLGPEPEEPLIELQRRLLNMVPECDDVNRFAGGFTPHLSVGQVRGRAPLKELLEKLHQSWNPLSFLVSDINLIWRGDPPDDTFRRARTVELTGQYGGGHPG